MDGLRTLAITQRILTQEEYERFRSEYQRAASEMVNREAKIRKVIDSIEVNMDFLGVTGVEDKLQEGVDKVIGKLNSGGIKVWMLTGDKKETAVNLAHASGKANS